MTSRKRFHVLMCLRRSKQAKCCLAIPSPHQHVQGHLREKPHHVLPGDALHEAVHPAVVLVQPLNRLRIIRLKSTLRIPFRLKIITFARRSFSRKGSSIRSVFAVLSRNSRPTYFGHESQIRMAFSLPLPLLLGPFDVMSNSAFVHEFDQVQSCRPGIGVDRKRSFIDLP